MTRRNSNGSCPKRLSDMWRADTQDGSTAILSDASVSLGSFRLDEIGSFVWQLCDGTKTVDEIARELVAECEGPTPPHETVVSDTVRLLQSLRSDGLIAWDGDRCVDVLLVVPPCPSVYSKDAINTPEYSAPPLGLCYIAAVLRKHGYAVAILDLHQKAGKPEDVVEECRRRHPAMIGITATTPSYPNAERVARFAKAWDESVVTFIGGPHATGLPQQCASSIAIDFVCIGEGEQTTPELVAAVLRNGGDVTGVPGLAFESDGQIVFTGQRDRLSGLDVLSFPARELVDIDNYSQKGSIVSSRGCPIGCDFCSCAAIAGNTYRTHSIPYVLSEIEHMIEQHDCRFFDFHDDTFNLHSNRVFEFCSELQKRELDIEWGCFCRAAQMTSDMAQAMAAAGCKVIQYGVEAGNNRMLQAVGKNTSVQQVESAVQSAVAAGIEQVVCGFIIGHAQDTEDSVRDTINLGLRLSKLGATRLVLSLLTPYPGTAVYEEMGQRGIKLLTDDWEQYTFSHVVMETKNLSRDRLRYLYFEGVSRFLKASKR
jgi:radical SAM superfamily enzyme YgiQ (UPF0313 family)